MPLLAVRTRQPEVRRRARAPIPGIPRGTRTAVPFAAAFYGSITSSPPAQRVADTGTTNADTSRSATTKHTSTVLTQDCNVIAPWIGPLRWAVPIPGIEGT